MAAPAVASAQHVNSDLWVTNSSVNATAVSGNTLYIGGNFTYVGPAIGWGRSMSARGAARQSRVSRECMEPSGRSRRMGAAAGSSAASILVGNVPRANLASHSLEFHRRLVVVGYQRTARAIAATPAKRRRAETSRAPADDASPYVASMNATTGVTTGWNPTRQSRLRAGPRRLGGVCVCGIFTK